MAKVGPLVLPEVALWFKSPGGIPMDIRSSFLATLLGLKIISLSDLSKLPPLGGGEGTPSNDWTMEAARARRREDRIRASFNRGG